MARRSSRDRWVRHGAFLAATEVVFEAHQRPWQHATAFAADRLSDGTFALTPAGKGAPARKEGHPNDCSA